MRLSSALLLLSLSVVTAGCCKKGDSSGGDVAPTPASTATATATATATPDTPAKPAPLDDATKKKLHELFDKNKLTMKKCDPAKADLDRTIAAKDFKSLPPKTIAFNACRRSWVVALMPQIAKIGPITEDQAFDEMMTWHLTVLKK